MTPHAIILASGTGTRFGSTLPKQFATLQGQPVLMHTIARFAQVPGISITVVLAASARQLWQQLCAKHHFNIPHHTVTGGDTRYQSVKNALATLPDSPDSLVAIHDGVRPLVSTQLIQQAFSQAERLGSAIPATTPTDTIRQYDTARHTTSTALTRDSLRAVQTPQTFRTSEIKQAYSQSHDGDFTDDASVYEHAGYTVSLIAGQTDNIKITHPIDLTLASIILKQQQQQP